MVVVIVVRGTGCGGGPVTCILMYYMFVSIFSLFLSGMI